MNDVKPVRRTNLVGQVTDALRRGIQTGRWPVGTRIPTEPELAELTGTGRNTVREAVQGLVHAGLLERRQGSGTYVLATSLVGTALTEYFATARERDTLELRRALDVTAAELAARRRTDDDVARLRRALDERCRAWEGTDTDLLVAADVALHHAIVVASHNSVYVEFYDSLLPAITQTVDARFHATGEGFHDEHNALVEAVIAGDAPAAAAAARALFSELLA
ncbi:FadR/GntR family transcriptional regulator [Rhodococcus sp. HNM0569]|uniref:FadR/GntR family transcriptional regulator n=1 Tax=Rhodococcus sp. HNM0569 TaxID=2716340 RepID=UPI00146F5105|nr:FadR/GntR family transcriptional regulator [Rhodococcus sp. HNM0569]NLU81954.1 FadR family transcriptional regulator [Rhodococcus sp. HNM0569]